MSRCTFTDLFIKFGVCPSPLLEESGEEAKSLSGVAPGHSRGEMLHSDERSGLTEPGPPSKSSWSQLC